MENHSDTSEFVLTPAMFHILLALADGDRHGYVIMQMVARETDGSMRLGPGTLYRSIRVLLAHQLIEEAESHSDPALDDERRRYYHLTDLGVGYTRAEIERLRGLVRLAQSKSLLAKLQPDSAA